MQSIWSTSDRTQDWSGSGVGLIRGPFSLQTDPSDARSRITLEPINGVEPVFLETNPLNRMAKCLNNK